LDEVSLLADDKCFCLQVGGGAILAMLLISDHCNRFTTDELSHPTDRVF